MGEGSFLLSSLAHLVRCMPFPAACRWCGCRPPFSPVGETGPLDISINYDAALGPNQVPSTVGGILRRSPCHCLRFGRVGNRSITPRHLPAIGQCGWLVVGCVRDGAEAGQRKFKRLRRGGYDCAGGVGGAHDS